MTARALIRPLARAAFLAAVAVLLLAALGALARGDQATAMEAGVVVWAMFAIRRRLRRRATRGRPPLLERFDSTLDLAARRRAWWRRRPLDEPVIPMGIHLGHGTRRTQLAGIAGSVRDVLGGSRARDIAVDLVIEPELLRQHALILGSSGTGKTNAIAGLMTGLGEFGVGQVLIDLKGDTALINHATAIDPRTRVFRLDAGVGHWDPFAYGDPGSLRDMLMDLEEWTEPHYEQAARRFLGALLDAIHTQRRPSLSEVQGYLENPDHANELVGHCRHAGHDRQARALENGLDLLRGDRTLRSGVVGLGNRLAVAADSPTSAGRLSTGDTKPVDLDTALNHQGLVVFSLPAARYPFEAKAIGSMALSACLGRAAELHNAGAKVRAQIIVDEAALLLGPQLIRAERLGRSLGLGIVFATQALNDLRALNAAEPLWESTALKLVFRQDVPDAAEWIAKSIGTDTVQKPTVQYERKFLLRIPSGLESEREVEEWTIHPNTIRRLTTGRAVAVRRWPRTEISTINLNRYL